MEIKNEDDYNKAINELENIQEKNERHEELSVAVKKYEDNNPGPSLVKPEPFEALAIAMEAKGDTQTSIAALLRTGQGNVSLMLRNRKPISEIQAKKLGEHFGVDYDVFWKGEQAKRQRQKKKQQIDEPKIMLNGEATTSISIGNSQSVGEFSQENPVIVKDKLPATQVKSNNYSEVALSYGLTKSLGNFEFIRCDVWVKDFCDQDKKQECWDNLNKEVTVRLEKVLQDIEKFKPVQQSLQPKQTGIELPPLLEEQEINQAEKIKKAIHKEVFRLAKAGRIKYHFAIKKLQEATLSDDFSLDLLAQLLDNNITFFIGDNNGNSEQQQIESNSNDVGSERSEQGSEGNDEGASERSGFETFRND